MDYDSLLEIFKKRRSIRRYKKESVSDELIAKIVEAARWAPSGANKQPWEFIVIRNESLKKRIVEIIEEQFEHMAKMEVTKDPALRIRFRPPELGDSVFILPCCDPRTLEITNVYARVTRGGEILAADMANAFLYMALAATALGLGSRWVSVITCAYPQCLIKDLLGVPKDFILYDMLVVGHSDEVPAPRLVRQKGELLHSDYYDKSKFRTDSQVNDFLKSCLPGGLRVKDP